MLSQFLHLFFLLLIPPEFAFLAVRILPSLLMCP